MSFYAVGSSIFWVQGQNGVETVMGRGDAFPLSLAE